jgi:predicted CopG family antitoxin
VLWHIMKEEDNSFSRLYFRLTEKKNWSW